MEIISYSPNPPTSDEDLNRYTYDEFQRLSAFFVALLENRDQHISIQNANFGKGNTAPSQVIIGDFNGWEFTIGDDAVFTIEMNHDVDATKSIEIHFTYVVNEAYVTNGGEVQFQAEYSVIPHNGNGDTLIVPKASGTLTTGDMNISTLAYEPQHSASMTVPVADFNVGDMIGITFSRIAITDGNNPTANPVITTLHLEYESKFIDWFASEEEG